jgi:aryl-alcohol dehydrogenase-like predicted oxidoreductase
MEYRYVGGSGLRVSELCLGTMTFGNEADESSSHAILDRHVEAGGDFIDTADVYAGGASEEVRGGRLTGKYRRGMTSPPAGTRGDGDKQPWLGNRQDTPIIGARTVEQLTDDLGATGWSLDDKHMEQLTAAGARPLPYPHAYLARSPRRRG